MRTIVNKTWVVATVVVMLSLVTVLLGTKAYADDPPPLVEMWGWGVATGAAAFEHCKSGCLPGIPGTGDGQFNHPQGVATDAAGNVYVVDGRPRVLKFSSTGEFLEMWGWGVATGTPQLETCTSGCLGGISGGGDGQFSSADAVATDAAGNVYVSNTGNDRIQKFTSDGQFILKWGSSGTGDGQLYNPTGVASDAAGNVYVSDGAGAPGRVQKFTGDGQFIFGLGPYGKGATHVATDAAGNVYFADGDVTIRKFSGAGQFILQWGVPMAYAVATDFEGNVYVTDIFRSRIQRFTSDGQFITQWGSPGTGDGQFNWPAGVATDAALNVYVSDSNNDRIQKFRFGITGVGDPPSVDRLSLSATPNPFTQLTQISFTIPQGGPTTVSISDVLGRHVRQWTWSTLSSGRHQVDWNGLADDGRNIPPSVLFYQVQANGHTLRRKLVHLQ